MDAFLVQDFDEAGNSLIPLSVMQANKYRTQLPYTWQRTVLGNLYSLLDKRARFPCLFGLVALRKRYMKVSFHKAMDEACSVASVAHCLASFAEGLIQPRSNERRMYETMACLFEEGSWEGQVSTFSDVERLFWAFLEKLHSFDTMGWPEGTTKDPNAISFRYYFHGLRWFPLFFSSLHEYKARKASSFMVVFQPTDIFEFHRLVNPHFPQLQSQVHQRIADYSGEPAQFYTVDHGAVPEMLQCLGPHQDTFVREMWSCPMKL